MLRLGRRFVTRNMDDVFDLGHSALQNTQSLANNAPVGVRALHSTIRRRNALFRFIMKERVVLVGGVQNGGVMKASSQQIRNFSEANAGEEKKAPTSLAQYDYDDYDDYEADDCGGKVAMWTRMMLNLPFSVHLLVARTTQELFPEG